MKSSPAARNAVNHAFVRRYLGAALALLALAISGFAAVRWTHLLGGRPQAIATTSDTRAWALLGRALHANSDVPFAAHVETVVFVGERSLQSEARIVKTPGHLAITYLSGPMKGQSSGFTRQLFWRQNAAGQIVPYAQTATAPAQIANRRFEWMRANYQAQMRPASAVDGRPVEVVELRPARGALAGPARRIFIDDATGLTLRIEEFNARLQPASHSTFSRLDLHSAIAPNTFHAPAALLKAGQRSFWRGEELGDDARAVERKTGLTPPQSGQVPRGWKRDGFGVHRCVPGGGALQVAAFTRYTDGLNSLTLFAIRPPATAKNAPDARRAVPASCSFGPGALVSRADGGGTLLAVGDLPPEIMRRALEAARFRAVAPLASTPATSHAPPE